MKLNAKVAAARKMYSAINKKFVSKKEVNDKTKMAVHLSTFFLYKFLLYRSESWALNQTDQSPSLGYGNEVLQNDMET